MDAGQRDKTLLYLDQLLTATKSGMAIWSEANPSTYVWQNKQKGGRIVLQKTGVSPTLKADGQLEISASYVLQALDRVGTPQLMLQGSDDTKIGERLSSLFEHIMHAKTQAAIDFLGSILPETKPD